MKKRLSALLIAVICLAITAVSAFAYTPNEYPTLKTLYPEDVKFYGYKPNLGLGYTLQTMGYVDDFYCPSCGWWVVGWEIPLEYYTYDDVNYYENNNGLMFIGNYTNTNAYAVSGYLKTTNADGTPRVYGSNVGFECCVRRGENIYKNLDVAVFYDEYEMHIVYSHVNPLEDWTPTYNGIMYQALLVKEDTTTYNNVSGAYNQVTFNSDNRDDYANYNNRVINVDPFYSIYGTGSGGYEDGYEEGYNQGYQDGMETSGGAFQEGYNVGYEEGYTNGNTEGYRNGFDVGRIQGQTDQEMLDGMFGDLFDGLFGSLEGFTNNLLSLGWGTLTIGAMLGLLGVVLVTMLIIKIIRG